MAAMKHQHYLLRSEKGFGDTSVRCFIGKYFRMSELIGRREVLQEEDPK